MAYVAGIDPGTNGAVAIYDTDTRRVVNVYDLPFWYQTVGKKKRKRLDPVALSELIELLPVLGVELAVMEAVGGRPRQSASAGFVFGYTVGLIYMACMFSGLMVETVQPARWKKMLNVPGKAGSKSKEAKKQAEGDIMNRVNEIFPLDRSLFRTERGAYRMDRADAALLAKFGGDYVMPTMRPLTDTELKLAYINGETGA